MTNLIMCYVWTRRGLTCLVAMRESKLKKGGVATRMEKAGGVETRRG
jgi:hypothetical protein